MSKRSRVPTIDVPWRKVCAALPALALVGGGITLNALAGPDIKGVGSPAIVVPDVALAPPFTGSRATSAGSFAVASPETPALVLPAGIVPGSSTPMTLDSEGIPVRALKAYREAASLIGSADPGCHIDWALPAAIGRVESDHARFAGNRLDSAGVARPGIIGVSLDGSNGTARITDSDGGRLDRDNVYDRAVGPMQFIPSTWRVAGTDADGDKVKNPQDMADAATAAAIYLCSGPGDLSRPKDLYAAVLRYNASDSYVRTVSAIAEAYRHGVTALPASDLPSARSPRSTSVAARPVSNPRMATLPRRVLANVPQQRPTVTTPAPAPGPGSSLSSSTSTSPVPAPSVTAPPAPAPSVTAPPAPAPSVTAPHAPAPSVPAPPAPAPSVPASPDHPASPVPPLPVPAAPDATSCTPPVADPAVTTPAVPPAVPHLLVPVPKPTDSADPVPTTLIPCTPATDPPPSSTQASGQPTTSVMPPTATPSGR